MTAISFSRCGEVTSSRISAVFFFFHMGIVAQLFEPISTPMNGFFKAAMQLSMCTIVVAGLSAEFPVMRLENLQFGSLPTRE